jgi:hypothetical protein
VVHIWYTAKVHSSLGNCCFTRRMMERVKGIEPSYEAWEAAVLPLNYTRVLQLVDPRDFCLEYLIRRRFESYVALRDRRMTQGHRHGGV